MSIPDYQTLMLPLLKSVIDGVTYKTSEIKERLAIEFNLTPEERWELLPSGTQSIFDNRVTWARTYLVKAKLLDAPKRAHIKISIRVDTPDKISSLRRSKLTTFCRPKWSVSAGAN